MALRHPDKIFTTALPPPPPWPAPTSPSPSPTWKTLHWKESGPDDKTLTGVLLRLQYALRSVHKRKISWPVEASSSSKYAYFTTLLLPVNSVVSHILGNSLTPNEYLLSLLGPIPDIFNQLHSPRYLKTPMKCISVDFDHCQSIFPTFFPLHFKMNVHSLAIFGATFEAENFKLWRLTPPMVLSFVRRICSQAWCYKILTPGSSSQTIYSIPTDKSLPALNMHFP